MKDKSKEVEKSKTFSFDWLIGGVLVKLGDTFDRLTGRSYKPSSSLATSELIERLKMLLDKEVKTSEENRKFVPHNLKLKMQWDKFSADSDEAIEALENELHIAAIDHINDRRYYTYAPITIEIKPDYFTEGVKLLASFEKFDEDEREVEVNVTVPEIKIEGLASPEEEIIPEEKEIISLSFTLRDKPISKNLKFALGERKSVGRTKENDISINDVSISKIHAAFVLNSHNKLMLADTGSTNGTFINEQRIAYGRAFPVKDGDLLKFGTVEVELKHLTAKPEVSISDEEENQKTGLAKTEQISEGNLSNSENFKEKREIKSKNGINKNQNPEVNKSSLSEEKSFNEPVRKQTSPEEKDQEDELNITEQGIVFDFEDNK